MLTRGRSKMLSAARSRLRARLYSGRTTGYSDSSSAVSSFRPWDPAILDLMKGPEPVYEKINSGFKVFKHKEPVKLQYGNQTLAEFELAYETWGTLNSEKSNAVLVHTGLSASSHAASHPDNPSPGWWEDFIGPGKALDTNKYFVICVNVLGGCYGSTGPSSVNPDPAANGERYATDFPIIGILDMVRTQFLLLDHLGIDRLYASVGSSMGGMQSLMAARLFPERVERVVSVSACGKSHPMSIAMRFVQRSAIMSDPAWHGGRYYNSPFPKRGMVVARQVATIAYRSGGEWESRFGRRRTHVHNLPSLDPDFLIESYCQHQAEEFCLKFDANSLLYISKAMDLFDLSEGAETFRRGLSRIKCPTLIIGVDSDILFPISQQVELHETLREAGNYSSFVRVNSPYGHDTFLIDVENIGGAIAEYLRFSPPFLPTQRTLPLKGAQLTRMSRVY